VARSKGIRHREPSGRRSRAEAEDIPPPTSAKRLRDAAIARMADAEWGTELGRLWLAGKISAPQYQAGKRWWNVREAYLVAIGSPMPYPPAPGNGYAYAAEDPPITTKEGRRLREKRERAVAEYDQATAALGNGVDVLAAFRLTMEHEQAPIGAVGLSNLAWCLDRLARHWRIAK
jgi:hypothetical protein